MILRHSRFPLALLLGLMLIAGRASAETPMQGYVRALLNADDATVQAAASDPASAAPSVSFEGKQRDYAVALAQSVMAYRQNFRQALQLIGDRAGSAATLRDRYLSGTIPFDGAIEEYRRAVLDPMSDEERRSFSEGQAATYLAGAGSSRASVYNMIFQLLKLEGTVSGKALRRIAGQIVPADQAGFQGLAGKLRETFESSVPALEAAVDQELAGVPDSGADDGFLSGGAAFAGAAGNGTAASGAASAAPEAVDEGALDKTVRHAFELPGDQAAEAMEAIPNTFPREIDFTRPEPGAEPASDPAAPPRLEEPPAVPDPLSAAPPPVSPFPNAGASPNEPLGDENPPADPLMRRAWDGLKENIRERIESRVRELVENAPDRLLDRAIETAVEGGAVRDTGSDLMDRLDHFISPETPTVEQAAGLRSLFMKTWPFVGSRAIRGLYDYGSGVVDAWAREMNFAVDTIFEKKGEE